MMLAKVGPGIRFNEHIEGDGETVFRHACNLRLEGIVSKRKESPWAMGLRKNCENFKGMGLRNSDCAYSNAKLVAHKSEARHVHGHRKHRCSRYYLFDRSAIGQRGGPKADGVR
jgi:hypothetical protein